MGSSCDPSMTADKIQPLSGEDPFNKIQLCQRSPRKAEKAAWG